MNDKRSDFLVIPERIQLESVFGCNARCKMCPVHFPSKRKKGVMSFDLFKYIVDEMLLYKENITKFDLWGLGEPLLDKDLFQKIRYAKEKGFRNLAIATNVDLLGTEPAKGLFACGLDTVIFSIDGTSRETQESIRANTTFERVTENARRAISIRDEGGYATRFVFRFIRQERNRHEWRPFYDFWGARISKEKGDMIIGYDVHSWGGEISVDAFGQSCCVPAKLPCHHIHDRLIILWDGTVPLCCSDMHNADYKFGKVVPGKASPIEMFNSSKSQEFRKIHATGQRMKMDICAKCTILESEKAQEVL